MYTNDAYDMYVYGIIGGRLIKILKVKSTVQ